MPHNICFCSTKLSTSVEKKKCTMRESERSLWNSEDKRNNGDKITGIGKTFKKKDRNKFIDWKREKRETQCDTVQNRQTNEEIARDVGLHCLPKSAVECILDYTQATFLNEKGHKRNPYPNICSEFCASRLERIR